MTIVCFEDSHVVDLHPITIARPSYAITCAGFRLFDWLASTGKTIRGHVRPHLRLIQELDFKIRSIAAKLEDDDWANHEEGLLLINARLSPSVDNGTVITKLTNTTQSGVIVDQEDRSILAARITAKDLAEIRKSGLSNDGKESESSAIDFILNAAKDLPKMEESLSAFRLPHDLVKSHMKEMAVSNNHRLRTGDYTETADGLFVGKNVKIGQYAVVDTTDGPLIFEDNCNIGPFCYLSGPVYAGVGCRVIEHSALKDGVSLGHTTKIGGEVEASVIEPYTNKQHHGFLGHSYLGSWINLGAGTCNSDLKNTYGKINITYGDNKVASGMQFLGCFVGDYSKTAINTSIFTGKVIGVCSMMYGFVTSNVPSYVNYARLFGQTSLLPADVMINTQKRMFSRRKVEQRECDKQLIRDMYQLTAGERTADPDLL